MAVEFGRTSCVRLGRTPTIRASFLGTRDRAAMLNPDVRARRQVTPQAKLRHTQSDCAGRRLDSMTREEG